MAAPIMGERQQGLSRQGSGLALLFLANTAIVPECSDLPIFAAQVDPMPPGARALAVCLLALLASAALAADYALANCDTTGPPISDDYTLGGGNDAAPDIENCYRGAPVNCATGNQTEEQTDLALGGRGPALHVTRTYNSQAAAEAEEAGPWGYGWSGPYSSHLDFGEEGAITVVQENGAAAAFLLEEGEYVPGPWVQATLVKEGENYVFTLPDQEKLRFDSEGRLTEQEDRNGNSLSMTYEAGNLTAVEDDAGRKLQFLYWEGRILAVKDPMGHFVLYGVASGNLTTVMLWGGKEEEEPETRWEFAYDGSHQLTEMSDGRGGVTKTVYDEKNRAKKQTDPMERVIQFAYGESGGLRTTTITEANGSTTFQKFNEAGEPLEVIKAKGTGLERKSTYEYDSAYRLVKATDALGHSTTFGYDEEGNRTLEKDAEGDETKWTYNATHDVLTETTPKGEKTTYKRDANGSVEAIERPAPGETTQKSTFDHAENGDLESTIDPLGNETGFEYDSYGNLKAETDPEGNTSTWMYDKNGRVLTSVSPRGNEEGAEASEFETTIERDEQGRPVLVTDPLGRETEYAYDENGNLKAVTDGKGQTTTYTYNANDERTEVEADSGDTVKFAYDSMGAVKSRTNGRDNTTTYEHDALGQLTEEEDPLERTTIRKYDAAGNLEEIEDAIGRTVSYSYDKADRPTEIDYSQEATPDVTYEYDKDGNVVKMIDGSGTTTRTYDQLGRLTKVVNGRSEVVEYEYNLGNQQTEIVYPNGEPVEREFDKSGRMKAVTDWLGNETTFEYNADSQIEATVFPEGTANIDEYAYSRAGELSEISMKHEKEVLASMAYTRDAIGQITKAVETGFPEVPEYSWGYDAKNRLTKSNGTTFGYDSANNVTKISSTTYEYDKADQIESASNASFEFNEVGQRVKTTPSGGSATTYSYDQAGNLSAIDSPGIDNTFEYDGNGLRIKETKDATTYKMVWDSTPGLPLMLRAGNDYYVYGPDGLPIEEITSGSVDYLHHDQLGSTRVLTNSSGEVTGTYRYGPNGAFWKHTGSSGTLMGFAGQQRMRANTQLIYLRARTYDPVTAQFLSPDPLAALSGETYGYAAADPVNLVDPTGLIPVGCGDDGCEPYCPPKREVADQTAKNPSGKPPKPMDLVDPLMTGARDSGVELLDVYGNSTKYRSKAFSPGKVVGRSLGKSFATEWVAHNLENQGFEDAALSVRLFDYGSGAYGMLKYGVKALDKLVSRASPVLMFIVIPPGYQSQYVPQAVPDA
jgi:RHS repeat-associated protein